MVKTRSTSSNSGVVFPSNKSAETVESDILIRGVGNRSPMSTPTRNLNVLKSLPVGNQIVWLGVNEIVIPHFYQSALNVMKSK